MSNKFKFELNKAGVKELLKSDAMVGVLKGYAYEVSNRAGEGYDVYIGPNRANVSVGTATDAAAQGNYDNNTLLKAVR